MTKKLEINFTKKPEMVFQFDQFLNVEKEVDKFLNNKENLQRLIAPLLPENLDEIIDNKIPIVKDGEDGLTPTDEQLIALIEPRIPEPLKGDTPKKGIDYFTKKELEEVKKSLKVAIMSEMTNHVTKEEVNIKLEEIKKQINKLPTTGGAQFLRQLMDVNVGTPTAQQYGLTYNPSRSEFSLTSITGGGSSVSPLTTKGDIYGFSTVDDRIPVGADNYVLTADSTDPLGVSWQPPQIGGKFTFYWTPTASDVATNFVHQDTPYATLSTFTTSSATTGQLLRTYITPAGQPGLTFIPAGEYRIHVHANVATIVGKKDTSLRAEIWETNSSGVDIVKLADCGPSTVLTAVSAEYIFAFSDVQKDLASSSSRIRTKLYAVISGAGGAPDITVSVGDGADSNTIFPSQTVSINNFVPYTGAVRDVNLGSFDLSVADEVYGSGWNASLEVPTKNAVYDKIESLVTGVSSVTGTANRITSSGGATPVIDIAATYVGQASITTLGTIATGTWTAGVIGLAYGGWGITNTRTSSTATGTANNLSITTVWYVWSGASSLNISGIAALADGVEIVLSNQSSAQSLILNNQSASSTAANRIITPGATNLVILPLSAVRLRYSGAVSRWVLASGYGQATSSLSGYLSSTDWSTFNAKIGGTGSAGAVPYFTGTSTVGANSSVFSFAPNTNRFSVGGVGYTNEEATGHFKSNTIENLAGLSTASVTRTQFTLLSAPSGSTATQSAGHLYAPTSLSTNVVASTTNYMAGDVIDYRITAYDSTGTLTYSVVNSITQATIINGTGAADGDYVDIAWTDNTSGTATISGYVIERQVNSGGYGNSVDVGAVTSYHDDNTGWGSAASITPTFPDFIANNTTYSYFSYTKDVTPASTTVFSSGNFSYGMTDDNSGNPFVIVHSVTASPNARVLYGANYYDGTSFTQDTTTFVAGNTVTPNTYGYLSDGSTLNRDYSFYNKGVISGAVVYSSTSLDYSSTDPNDGNYYYNILTFTGASVASKILRQINGGGYNDAKISATSPIYDDGLTSFGDSTTVTPTGVYPNAGLFANHGSTSADPATLVLRSLDGAYARLDFQDNTKVLLGSLVGGSTYSAIYGPGNANVQVSSQSIQLAGQSGGNISFVNVNTYQDKFETFNAISSGSVSNNSLFHDTSNGKISWKDGSGVVHALY